MSLHDEMFKQNMDMTKKAFKAIVAVWIFVAVIALTILGLGIWVACHFIAKIW